MVNILTIIVLSCIFLKTYEKTVYCGLIVCYSSENMHLSAVSHFSFMSAQQRLEARISQYRLSCNIWKNFELYLLKLPKMSLFRYEGCFLHVRSGINDCINIITDFL